MYSYTIDNWKFEFDKELTMYLYSQISSPVIWQCNCNSCQNYDSVRNQIYPAEFLDLLILLGINPIKEAEIYHIEKHGFKQQLYGGWYHFVGKFIKNSENFKMSYLTINFQICLSNKVLLVPDLLKPYPVLQLEFKTTFPSIRQ